MKIIKMLSFPTKTNSFSKFKFSLVENKKNFNALMCIFKKIL